MKKTALLCLALLLALPLVALAEQDATFSGVYNSEWGRILLIQKEGEVVGLYVGQFVGGIKGTVADNKLTFAWEQLNGEKGRGWFELAANGLSGKWGNGESADDGGVWNARLIERPAAAGDYCGTWKSNWGRIALLQLGKYVLGAYDGQFKGGIIGEADGKTIRFKWLQRDGKGRGSFTFDDAGAFTGKWGSGDSETDGGDWTGQKD